MKFYINYGTGEPQCCEKDDPGDVTAVADKGASLTHEPIIITNDKGRVMARRDWYETLEGIANQTAPIRLGEGYYGDWRMPMYVVRDMD
jgi:hypothetical protein